MSNIHLPVLGAVALLALMAAPVEAGYVRTSRARPIEPDAFCYMKFGNGRMVDLSTDVCGQAPAPPQPTKPATSQTAAR